MILLLLACTPVCEDTVTVTFSGQAATISGTPLGLDDSARSTPVDGRFTYGRCIGDTNTSPDAGEYNDVWGYGDFLLRIQGTS